MPLKDVAKALKASSGGITTARSSITHLFLYFPFFYSVRSFSIISFILILSVRPRKLQLGTKEA